MKFSWFRREREADLDAEIRSHLDEAIRDRIARGERPDEARVNALREFGNVGLVKEVTREMWGWNSLEHLLQDLRFGLRMLLKRPGFTLVAILSLALGTGANTAIFSLVNMMLLRPLPIEKPAQLVSLNNTSRSSFPTFSYPNYKDLRDRNDVFSGLIAYRLTPLSLSHDGINERVWGYEVSGNYFETLGVKTALGRTIQSDDDQLQSTSPVAVMSYKCWQQRFGSDPNVIGKDVIVNGSSYKIIGVASRGFYGTEIISAPELWFPIAMQQQLENGRKWLDDRGAENLFLQGRLKDDVSLTQAQAALDLIGAQLEREYPEVNEGKRITLSPPGLFGNAMRGAVVGFAGLLMAVVGLVLLLACTNLANLLLARATERRREVAVRLAVGASRFRVVRQLLTESLLLALIGGALGLVPALWLVNLAMAIKVPPSIPLSFELQIDYRVYLFTLLLSLLTGVLFGLLPALQATKIDQISALKNEVSFVSGGRSWLKSGLIVLQVSLSLVLLVGGGLMLRSLERASTIELGFETAHAAEISFDLRLQGYESERAKVFQKTILERVRNLPGVQSAGIADMIPVDLHFSRSRIFIEGQTIERIKDAPGAMFNSASPGYFSAMKTRLVQGRDFTERDDEKAPPVAIINEAFARRFFPGENPLGKRFSLGDPEAPKRQIVGVVQDGKYAGLNENARSYVSLPLWQSGVGATSLVIRSDGDLPKVIAAVRREVEQLDPHIPISSNTLVEKMELPLLATRLTAYVFGTFGALALALAAIGIYGVMSYAISTRTREIGIRMALGAQKANVLTLVMRQGITLTIVGLAIGLAVALGLAQLMKTFLFGVSANDPATFILTSAVLATVALIACYLPARRATKVDPIVALRHE